MKRSKQKAVLELTEKELGSMRDAIGNSILVLKSTLQHVTKNLMWQPGECTQTKLARAITRDIKAQEALHKRLESMVNPEK